MALLIVVFIAVSLSMDAFSLALAYGTIGLSKKEVKVLSSIVGIYHFFMPLFGMYFGTFILSKVPLSPNFVVFLVLSVIGIQMFFSSFKEEKEVKRMHFLEFFSFGLAVSLDSFSVGIGLQTIYQTPLVCSFIFMVSSAFFTYIGLKLGKELNDKLGKISTRFGGAMLFLLGVLYTLK